MTDVSKCSNGTQYNEHTRLTELLENKTFSEAQRQEVLRLANSHLTTIYRLNDNKQKKLEQIELYPPY